MRSDTVMGLNNRGQSLIEGDKVVKTEYDEFHDFEKHPLYKYEFGDGRIYYEIIQCQGWCGGPIFFLSLIDGNGICLPQSLWTPEEMENNMKAWEIVAWTYDAALHCPSCASKAGMDRCGATDSEGNEPRPVFASDELEGSRSCDDCFAVLNN